MQSFAWVHKVNNDSFLLEEVKAMGASNSAITLALEDERIVEIENDV